MSSPSMPGPSVPVPTLYDQVGGTPAIRAAVDLLLAKIVGDPELSPFFSRVALGRHSQHLGDFLISALGGPDRYTGRSIDVAHARLDLTDRHFDLVAGHLVATLAQLGVADDVAAQLLDAVAGLRPLVVRAPTTAASSPS